MTPLLVIGVLAAIVAPHLLDLDRARPVTAATVWAAALALRALTVVSIVVLALWYVPTTELFSVVTHWCWHTVLPLLADHVPVDGHMVGDAALIAPAFALAASVCWVAFGLWRGTRAVRALVVRHAGLEGPEASVIVPEAEVLLATAGLRRPRVLVSAGALLQLDDEELAAGLAHERGHIERGHRFVIVAAQLLGAVGRGLPGTRTAVAELALHLERDADAFALRRHERLALASAICKAGLSRAIAPAPMLALDGGHLERRIAPLLGQPPRGRAEAYLRLLATSMVLLVLAAAAAVPASAGAAYAGPASGPSVEHCE